MIIRVMNSTIVRTLIIFSTLFCLNGCFTYALWRDGNYTSQTPLTSPGKPHELSVNLNEKKICLSYYPENATGSKNAQYLLINEGDYRYSFKRNQILNDILSDSFPFHVSSIVARAHRHGSSDIFLLFFLGRFKDGVVVFEKEGKYPIDSKDDFEKLFLDYDTEMARTIIRQRWQSEFHEMLPQEYLHLIAWIDRNKEIKTSPIDYQKMDEVNGLILAIEPPVNDIKFVRLNLNYRLFNYLGTANSFVGGPIIPKRHNKEEYYFQYGARQRLSNILTGNPVQSIKWLNDYDCKSGDWMRLPTEKAQSFELYYNTSQDYHGYEYALPVRILGSPFSAALDIVTLPFQYAYIQYLKSTGMH